MDASRWPWSGVVLCLASIGHSVGPDVAEQGALFRASVDRVLVDVVVTDANATPLTDLSRDEFSIIEGGKPQALAEFRFVSIPVAQRSPDPVELTPGDTATNIPASADSRLWALVVDDLHLIEADIVPVKRTLTDFVRALPSQDEVALVYIGRSDHSRNFTSELGPMLGAINRLRDVVGFGLDAAPQLARVDNRYVFRQGKLASDALRNVALSLADSGHPRRAIVYVGTMTTIEPESGAGLQYLVELERTFEQARRSNVPIYVIDPRGLVQPADAVRGGIGAITDERTNRQIVANINHQHKWLHTLAINTGGRAFTNSSSLTKAVHDIVGENGSFYQLAYSPDPLVRDGGFHEFTVKVTRPGTRVRARQGYVAPGARVDAPSLREGSNAAMSMGVNVAGLPLRAVATPLAPGASGTRAAVTIEVEYPTGGLQRIDDTLALTIYALDPDAKLKARSAKQLRFAGSAPVGPSVTLLLDEVLELPSQPLTLRIGVASQQLGRVGTVQLPIDVPSLAGAGLQLSGIAIGLADLRAPALNGLVLESLVPFQPVPARTFLAGQSLRVYGRAFWRSGGEPSITIALRGVPQSFQQILTKISPGLRGGREAAFDATVHLMGLTPGRHVLEITGDLGDRTPVKREVPFAIR